MEIQMDKNMNGEKYETEVHRRIYDNDNGQFITVRPSADFPGNVMLFAEGTEAEYFGAIRLDLPASMMRKIGEALIAASDEAPAI
jgi:hypothetical protein